MALCSFELIQSNTHEHKFDECLQLSRSEEEFLIVADVAICHSKNITNKIWILLTNLLIYQILCRTLYDEVKSLQEKFNVLWLVSIFHKHKFNSIYKSSQLILLVSVHATLQEWLQKRQELISCSSRDMFNHSHNVLNYIIVHDEVGQNLLKEGPYFIQNRDHRVYLILWCFLT